MHGARQRDGGDGLSRNGLGNRLSAVSPHRRRFLLGRVAALVLAVGLGALAVRRGGSSVPAVAQVRLGPLLVPGYGRELGPAAKSGELRSDRLMRDEAVPVDGSSGRGHHACAVIRPGDPQVPEG